MRSHVKIRFRGWREKREAPSSCCDNRDILDGIVVGRDFRRIANPQAWLRRRRNEWHRVFLDEPREVAVSDQTLRGNCKRPVIALLLTKACQNPGNVALTSDEVE